MTARKYNVVSNLGGSQLKKIAALKGQAKVVMEELRANTEPRFAEEINAVCGPRLVTRQDTLRVTLYYIIVFKGRGWVEAREATASAEVENAFAGIFDADGNVVEAEEVAAE